MFGPVHRMADPENKQVHDSGNGSANAFTDGSQRSPRQESTSTEKVENEEALQALSSPRSIHGISVSIRFFIYAPGIASFPFLRLTEPFTLVVLGSSEYRVRYSFIRTRQYYYGKRYPGRHAV